jgi:hypothetical protein
MKRKGITLVEILVAFFILSLISTTFYYILKTASHKRAVITCREEAKREVGKILKILTNDLQQARLDSFENVDDEIIRIKVRKPDSDKDVKLEYHYQKPFLRRKFMGKVWMISENLEKFSVEKIPDSPGQLIVEVKSAFAFDGLKQDEAQIHEMSQMIVMREDAARATDPHWRDVGSVSQFFKTQGDLLAGIKSDAKQVVQEVGNEFENMAEDIKEMTIGQIEQAKIKLKSSLKNVENKILDIDTKIADLDPEAIFDMGSSGFSRVWGGVSGRTKRLKKKAKKIKKALQDMKKKGEMNWSKIRSIAGGDKDRLRRTAKELFTAKSDIFNAGSEIIKSMKSFDMDTSDIDLNKWGL